MPDGFYFAYVGRLDDGTQFMAWVTGASPDGYAGDPKSDDWQTTLRWIAVLHQFDSQGNHEPSESRLGAFDIEGYKQACEEAEVQLQMLLAPLQKLNPQRGGISVKLFSVVLVGVTHGLTYESYVDDDAEGEWVALKPGDVALESPWDSGEYST